MSDDREMFIPATGVSRSRALELAGWYDNNPIVQALKEAEYDRGVAAGRRQAAEELMRQVGNTTGDQTPDQIRWFALEVLNDIAAGAPAEPVEEDTE